MYTYDDCNLQPDSFYSYKIISYNNKGKASSNFTPALISNRTLPENFSPFNAIQVNSTLVRLEWLRPTTSMSPSFHGYRIFRNSTSINPIVIEPFITTFFDFSNDFLPNQIIEYQLVACNTALDCDLSNYHNKDANSSFSMTSMSLKTYLKIKNEPPIMVHAPKLAKLTEKSALLDAKDCVVLRSPQTQQIIEYRFYVYELLVYRGRQSQYELCDLKPFTSYSVALEACTFLPGLDFFYI